MRKRDWTGARAKVEDEACCRLCLDGSARLDAAHVIPRSLNGSDENMEPLGIVPLCRKCHTAVDSHEADLLPVLSPEEQAHAVLMAGSLERARQLITGERL